jgi:hypothetical protein
MIHLNLIMHPSLEGTDGGQGISSAAFHGPLFFRGAREGSSAFFAGKGGLLARALSC